MLGSLSINGDSRRESNSESGLSPEHFFQPRRRSDVATCGGSRPREEGCGLLVAVGGRRPDDPGR